MLIFKPRPDRLGTIILSTSQCDFMTVLRERLPVVMQNQSKREEKVRATYSTDQNQRQVQIEESVPFDIILRGSLSKPVLLCVVSVSSVASLH